MRPSAKIHSPNSPSRYTETDLGDHEETEENDRKTVIMQGSLGHPLYYERENSPWPRHPCLAARTRLAGFALQSDEPFSGFPEKSGSATNAHTINEAAESGTLGHVIEVYSPRTTAMPLAMSPAMNQHTTSIIADPIIFRNRPEEEH